jgi:high-affinity iron transporter
MLATFVIGLREGLEAALIVGIIAAFLRRNGRDLRPMWIGVGLAVALSIAVGIGLDLVEQALPQAAQEGMEAAIGAIAVAFVTGMIAWMNTHARELKRQLEAETAAALGGGGGWALAGMAFLAVLREGFETSVFLLATFSVAQSAAWAAAGAALGLAMAVVVGWGIYAGGVRINLARFFRITGLFLILVAAGLVVTALRSAHEAGWLNVGQQPTISLAWLVAPGTVRSALLTGVLGIPADPRRIELLGWLAYLAPVAVFVYWPRSLRPAPRALAWLRLAGAGGLAAAALALALLYPAPVPRLPAEAPLVAAGQSGAPAGVARLEMTAHGPVLTITPAGAPAGAPAARLALPEDQRRAARHDGIAGMSWLLSRTSVPAGAPATLTLDRVIALAGGRVPVGLNAQDNPGPFDARWKTHSTTSVWVAGDVLLDAAQRDVTIVTLSGGGLRTPRTLTIHGADGIAPAGWRVAPGYRADTAAALARLAAARAEHRFWGVLLPGALALPALLLAANGARSLLRPRAAAPTLARTRRADAA